MMGTPPAGAGYVLGADLAEVVGVVLLTLVSLPVFLMVAAWLLGSLVGWVRWAKRRFDGRSAAERAATGAFPVVGLSGMRDGGDRGAPRV